MQKISKSTLIIDLIESSALSPEIDKSINELTDIVLDIKIISQAIEDLLIKKYNK